MTVADEAQRYLAVVEFFRALDCEPRWRPETLPVLIPAATPGGPAIRDASKEA